VTKKQKYGLYNSPEAEENKQPIHTELWWRTITNVDRITTKLFMSR
jgi:hypothetical protein